MKQLSVTAFLRRACLWLLVISPLLAGCLSRKKVIYLQNESLSHTTPVVVQNRPPLYRLQTNDVLSVQVRTLDVKMDQFFNLNSGGGQNMMMPGMAQMGAFMNGYSIDTTGHIILPGVGQLSVRGLTVVQAEELIQQHIDSFLNDGVVTVRLTNFVVSILGDVARPGRYQMFNNQATLLDVISMAGDLEDFADRQRIELIRQSPGQLSTVLIDLTDKSLLTSPYYYLQPNDVLYVRPAGAKITRSNNSNLGLVLGVITAISTTLLILTRVGAF